MMKKFLAVIGSALCISMTPMFDADASEWKPAGPITMMIAFSAGGGADTQARLIAEELEARHGWKIIPKQVTGKGGAILASKLKDEPNDGLTIAMVVTETLAYDLVAAKKAEFMPKDFTTLTTTAGYQMGIVALSNRGWKDIHDVFAAAKAGKPIRFGAMNAKLADLAYLLGKANGVEFNIISVKGGKAVMNGLNAGDIDVGWGAGVQTKSVLAGDMVNLASGNSYPLQASPNAPMLSDLGIKFNGDGYFMYMAPAGIPDEARKAISDAIGEIVKDTNNKAGKYIESAFGGAAVIKGNDLDAFLAEKVAGAKELIIATGQ